MNDLAFARWEGAMPPQALHYYRRLWAERRRRQIIGAMHFDRERHNEAVRRMLLARERQRICVHRSPPQLGMTRRVLVAVSETSGVSLNDMLGDRRFRKMVDARWVAAWMLKRHSQLSASEIGRKLGDRDHGTILHACNKVDEDLAAGGTVFGALKAAVERKLGVA